MNYDFSEQFTILRNEFRSLKNGIKSKSMLDAPALNDIWLKPAVLNASKQSRGIDLLLGSASDQPSPFKSSEPSDSSAESEITLSDEPKIVTSSRPNKSRTPVQRGTQCISDRGEDSLDGITLQQGSRKGHRKSREGCFNCKRRKIKVCTRLKSTSCLT